MGSDRRQVDSMYQSCMGQGLFPSLNKSNMDNSSTDPISKNVFSVKSNPVDDLVMVEES